MKATMDDPQRFLDVALEAVKKAEPIFLSTFGKATGIEHKEDARKSRVTDTDRELEKLIINCVLSQFPEHSIVAEESAARKGSEYVWYIDPIDGTTNFIRGIPHCSISIALWDAHGPLIGVVADPVRQNIFTAIRGRGAFQNDRRIGVSTTGLLKQAVGNLGWDWSDHESQRVLLEAMRRNTYRFRVFSGSALELCYVAAGQLDFFVSLSIHNWDFAAAALMVTEAGGTITEKDGRLLRASSSSLVATNGKLQGALIAALT